MGWDERCCVCSLKDKHTMLSMTQKNILQRLDLFVMSKCHRRWKKERSSLRLRQLEEAPRCAENAFRNNCQQGKVFSFWLSHVWGLQDMKLWQVIIHTPATCTRWDYWSHSHGPWCLGRTHPMAQPSLFTAMHHTPHCTRAPSVCLYGCSTLLNESTHKTRSLLLLPPPETERKQVTWWQNHNALVRSWTTASSVCAMGTRGLYFLGREERVRKWFFIAEGIWNI